MQIDIVTIFPEMFPAVLGASILQRAQDKALAQIAVHNLRDCTHDKRRTVDDRPYGGGPGMVMKPEPIFEAVEAIEARRHPANGSTLHRSGCQIVLTAAQGERFTQSLAKELAGLSHLLLVCGHYEGVDERVRERLVDREISIGDYVLTGGELPAMVVVDAVVRLLPGVLGDEQSAHEESFTCGLLEYPQYTRPEAFRGMDVPEILRSGNHEQIATWRKLRAVERTARQRPDLLDKQRKPPVE